MLRSRGHSDKSSDGRSGRRNPLVIAVSVVCALAVLVAAALLLKNPILFSAAQRQAEKENFIFAESLNKRCSSADSQLLAEYLDLRIDIDLRYPEMLSNFDPEIFRSWGERASTLAASSDAFKPALASQVKALEFKESSFGNALVVTHPEKNALGLGAKTSKIKLSGLTKEKDQFNAVVGAYWQRHQIMRAQQQQPQEG